ncbi:cytochrome c oxidase subunit 3 [Rhodoferax sp. WC2427]|uniref:cytochrome c oxidase subunit 3 n=1 Tax=Rhodoferax sp. WC2427 TaxID=3234144 RepID=UPI003464EC30
MNTAVAPSCAGWPPDRRAASTGTGLWVFMGVASALFSLFTLAYAMRMDGGDWSPIAMPWPLWLSTALLVLGSALLQRAAAAARGGRWAAVPGPLRVGGACALAFLVVQLWGWQMLQSAQVVLAGNPAASFFYLLTAMHGLHVVGGVVGWGLTVRNAGRAHGADGPVFAWRITLCARYWHFLLAVWLLLFAMLAWLTPEAVRWICGTA